MLQSMLGIVGEMNNVQPLYQAIDDFEDSVELRTQYKLMGDTYGAFRYPKTLEGRATFKSDQSTFYKITQQSNLSVPSDSGATKAFFESVNYVKKVTDADYIENSLVVEKTITSVVDLMKGKERFTIFVMGLLFCPNAR